MATLFIYGSSIPYGVGDNEEGGWGLRLRKYIDHDFPIDTSGHRNLVYNLGISGDTTKGLRNRLSSETESRLHEGYENIFIVSIGGNDAAFLRGSQAFVVPLEEFAENYSSIIEDAKKFSTKIITTTLTPVIDSITGLEGNKPGIKLNRYQEEYNQRIVQISAKYQIQCVDIYTTLSKNSPEALLSQDGVHPNSRGHSMIFGQMQCEIKVLLS